MATATKKAHAVTSMARAELIAPEAAPLEFLTYSDNDGGYHWEIVNASGETLARSGSFTSQDDAERAAHDVHEGALAARSEPYVPKEHRPVAA